MASESGISLGAVNKIIERKRELEELGDQSYCSPCTSAFNAAINMESLVLDMIIRGGKQTKKTDSAYRLFCENIVNYDM